MMMMMMMMMMMRYTAQVAVRVAFYDLLSEYKPVMAIKNQAGGGCRVKEGADQVIRKNSTMPPWNAVVKTFERYKFAITFENRQLKGYLTEKIMNALLAGIVPIYFGAPDIRKYLNEKRFIFCDVDASKVMAYPFPYGKNKATEDPEPLIQFVKDTIGDKLRECVEKVKRVDQDDDLYHQMVTEPILPGNRLRGSEFDVRTIVDRLDKYTIFDLVTPGKGNVWLLPLHHGSSKSLLNGHKQKQSGPIYREKSQKTSSFHLPGLYLNISSKSQRNSKELLSYSSTNTYWSSLIGLAGFFFGGAYIMGSQLSSSNDDGGNSKDLRQAEEAKKNDEGCLFEGKKPLVICGPSGVGKGTLLKMLFDEFEEQFSFCISHTTRKPRKGEVHGVNYYFVDKEDMVAEIEQGLFVEHASFAGNCYGTSYWALSNVEESGKVPVLEVDMQGAIQLNSRKDMKPIFCFIKPPNYEALADRLRKRGTESPEKVEKRLKQAKAELDFIDSQKSSFFQVVMVNDDLITSFKKLKSSIKSYYPHLREGSRKND
eukprot:jgi/Bigna1/91619/estExt_fgenesh1_pg.C_1090029